MKKTNTTWYIIRLIVVGFLVFSFISTSLNSSSVKKVQSYSLIKKAKDPANPDASFPIEDQENELESRGENKSESHVLFLCTLQDAILSLLSGAELKIAGYDTPYSGSAAGVPLYISKRALLI